MMFYNTLVAKSAGEPALFYGLFLDSVSPLNEEQIQYKEKLWDVLRKKKWCITVAGTVGNGKSLLACSALNMILDIYPYEAYYVKQEELADKVKASYDGVGENASRIVQRYEDCRLLIIDELTPRGWTEHTRDIVSRIISKRYDGKKPTILIGNVSAEVLRSMFEPHIISRLRTGHKQVMVAEDMRGREVV